MTIAIVDYGAGNLVSVIKAFAAVGASPRIVTDATQFAGAHALVIPGVGHFEATAGLDATRDAIRAATDAGVPLLGICLGMHWLFEGSDEAPGRSGLGALRGRCAHLPREAGLKIPHVGWNTLDDVDSGSRLLAGLPQGATAYFTHSYVAPDGPATVARTSHGTPFPSVVERGRIAGTQFHPEKSGAAGLQILAAFVAMARDAGVSC